MADIATWRRWLSEYYDKRASYVSRIDSTQGKIDRLKAAKQKIYGYEDLVASEKKVMQKKAEAYIEAGWQGSTLNTLQQKTRDDVCYDIQTYKNNVNYAADCIVDEITRLKNEKVRLNGLLGSINRKINNALGEIEKLLNGEGEES